MTKEEWFKALMKEARVMEYIVNEPEFERKKVLRGMLINRIKELFIIIEQGKDIKEFDAAI